MRHCNKCGVDIDGGPSRCPLCQGPLTGEPSKGVFPFIPTIYHKFHMFFKVFLFICILGAVTSVAANLLMDDSPPWSLFVVLGMGCVWLSLTLAVRKRKNIPKGMLYQTCLISVICVLWDALTGWNHWSLDFVVPILCLSGIITMAILSKILDWEIENTIIYLWIDALFGIVPLIFYFTDLLVIKIPSIICVAGSIISLAAIIIFKGDSIWAELKRKLSL